MNIERDIAELLFEHDCVIVPGFGGFVCNYSSANIHLSKHRFRPPYKKISFNKNLKNNDGLLANQVAQSRGISYSDSIRLISEYVHTLDKELSVVKHFYFRNIGTLYRGKENTLLFEQDETVNYLTDSFGLATFNSPPIQREPISRKTERVLKDKVILPSSKKKESIPVKRRLPGYVLASVAVLLIGCLSWVSFQVNLVQRIDYSSLNPFAAKSESLYQAAEMDFPDPDHYTHKENVNTLLAMASDTLRYINIVIDGRIPIIVQLKGDATAVVKTKKKDSKTEKHFHIVGGAFIVSENADNFYNKLVRDGYDASIIEDKEKNIRFVSYGGFSTKKEAMQILEKIRAVQRDVWLMTN